MLAFNAELPTAVLLLPVLLFANEAYHTAVFPFAVLFDRANEPIAVFINEGNVLHRAFIPSAVFHCIFHLQRPSIISQPLYPTLHRFCLESSL